MNHRDTFFYFLGMVLGGCAGFADVRVGDLLFTALLVLASCMLLGALRPRRPWRWVVVVGVGVPLAHLFAYLVLAQRPYRAQVYESFLAFLPGLAGAYGGSLGRGVVHNIFSGN